MKVLLIFDHETALRDWDLDVSDIYTEVTDDYTGGW
jgi:hypothetical protein